MRAEHYDQHAVSARGVAHGVLDKLEFSSQRRLLKGALSGVIAVAVAAVPYQGLPEAGRWTLFILAFAAALWVTEAIPAFAVGLVIMGLEIAILGRPGGVFATSDTDWEMFVEPWASPLLWLFFAGFVMGSAARKTGLDYWLAMNVLSRFSSSRGASLMAIMGITFSFSMFMSNTATAAMMLAVIAPVLASLRDDPFAKAIVLAVPFAANTGGMGTIIGTPPNGIAAGALAANHRIEFLDWMLMGLPPAVILAALLWVYLMLRYRGGAEKIDLTHVEGGPFADRVLPLWQRLVVMGVFAVTVGLWVTGAWHKIPVSVVSFVPICVFAALGVMDGSDMRKLPWDVLILIAGGLSLGVAVQKTGLAEWLVALLPMGSLGPLGLALGLSFLTMALASFMSHTAAANILIPIVLGVGLQDQVGIAVPVALSASTAMCMPISTPPNAMAFATGRVEVRDFLQGGLLVGLLGPAITVLWVRLVVGLGS